MFRFFQRRGTNKYSGLIAKCFSVGSSFSERTYSRRPNSYKLGLLTTKVRYTVVNTKAIQGRFTLARIGN